MTASLNKPRLSIKTVTSQVFSDTVNRFRNIPTEKRPAAIAKAESKGEIAPMTPLMRQTVETDFDLTFQDAQGRQLECKPDDPQHLAYLAMRNQSHNTAMDAAKKYGYEDIIKEGDPLSYWTGLVNDKTGRKNITQQTNIGAAAVGMETTFDRRVQVAETLGEQKDDILTQMNITEEYHAIREASSVVSRLNQIVPNMDNSIVVNVGSGAAPVGIALKAINPNIQVIDIEPDEESYAHSTRIALENDNLREDALYQQEPISARMKEIAQQGADNPSIMPIYLNTGVENALREIPELEGNVHLVKASCLAYNTVAEKNGLTEINRMLDPQKGELHLDIGIHDFNLVQYFDKMFSGKSKPKADEWVNQSDNQVLKDDIKDNKPFLDQLFQNFRPAGMLYNKNHDAGLRDGGGLATIVFKPNKQALASSS